MTYEYFKKFRYYATIAILSLFSLLFLPMIGSEAGLGWKTPDTVTGWIVYVTTKIIASSLNVMIFHCFVEQGRQNIHDDDRYKAARDMLLEIEDAQEVNPVGPSEWRRHVYGKKGLTIFITSLLSVIGLTQAVLTFDWISMLTYLFTVIMGIIFGVLQMNETEIYWTEEFPRYAKTIKMRQEAEKRDIKANSDTIHVNDCSNR